MKSKILITMSLALLLTGCGAKEVSTTPEGKEYSTPISEITVKEYREHRGERVALYTAYLDENNIEYEGLPYDMLQLEVYKLLPKPSQGDIEDLTDIYNVHVYNGDYMESALKGSFMGVKADDPNLPLGLEIKLGVSDDGTTVIKEANEALYEKLLVDWEVSYGAMLRLKEGTDGN